MPLLLEKCKGCIEGRRIQAAQVLKKKGECKGTDE
jgi:hypothetical protein